MNSTVTATGMKVKARAEKGLLINEVATASDSGWDDEAVANSLPGIALYPTSTKDSLKWWHANSKSATDEAGAASNDVSDNLTAGYYQLTSTAGYKLDTTDAVGDNNSSTPRQAEYSIFYINGATGNDDSYDDGEAAYYVMYKYYIKASNDEGLTLGNTSGDQNIAIKQINVTPADGDNNAQNARSTELNKALRVGVVMGGKMYIYAPLYGEVPQSGDDTDPVATYYVTDTYTAANGNTQEAVTNTAVNALKKNQPAYTALGSVNGAQGAGTEVDIYVWFEGEDDNCQSDKITPVLDDITIDVVFELVTLSANASFTNNQFTATSGS